MKIEKTNEKLLWVPSPEFKDNSNMREFMIWLGKTRGLKFEEYHELWNWSVTDIEGFWSAIWDFFKIKPSKPYDEVISGGKMPDVK